MNIQLLSIVLACLLCIASFSLAQAGSYQSNKKSLLAIYQGHPQTFYCLKPFTDKGIIQFLEPHLITDQANHISWEHLVPVSVLAHDRPCWQQPLCRRKNGQAYKGRLCCRKIDALFRDREADMHNLVPTIPRLNHARSHFEFRDTVSDISTAIDSCQFFVSRKHKQVQPPPQTKGMIARAYLYMHTRYQVPVSNESLDQYQHWHHQYPPDLWEKKRNQAIFSIQGNTNPWIPPINQQGKQ